MMEQVQRRAAQYVKGVYTYDASVKKDVKWESLESRREQFHLIMLYNILQQYTYLPSEDILKFHSQTSQYLNLATCSD